MKKLINKLFTNNIIFIIVFITIHLCLLGFINKVYAANMWSTIYDQLELNGSDNTTEKINIECHMSLLSIILTNESNVIETNMNKAPNRKRCEFALMDVLKRDTPFSLSFEVKTDNNFYYYNNYHMFFQIHGTPDSGEAWRCPILALESQAGTFRMYNRWDENRISKTESGTCASSENSINSRALFTDYSYESNTWYKFEINGVLSYQSDACLTIKINNELMSEQCGPNTFNDEKQPYLKFGIYKPTAWESDDEQINVQFRNINYKEI
jgi:hypothetical protein